MAAAKMPTFLDGNVWDYLFHNSLDLDIELPPARFSLAITREAEMEFYAIPDTKIALKQFILDAIARRAIPVDSWFGFAPPSSPADECRYGGFGIGRWPDNAELEFVSDLKNAIGSKKRPSKLYKNEADLALASRSFHSLVLSLDAKTGPLKEAQKLGGHVLFLNDLKPPETIADFVRRAYAVTPSTYFTAANTAP
jgi:hypothetical protein